MAQDQQTFKRASAAALIGLVTQLVLAIAIALVGLYAQSPALHAATWHLFGGLPIWIILWVLYHQHQLERVEALEAERLARGDARTAALFDESDDLAVARRRLEKLNKWWLPIVSGVVAVYLVAVGGTLLYLNYRAEQAGTLRDAAISPAAASNIAVTVVLLAIGFIAFLVARYVSGMTRVREWTLLRGGASYLMGAVVLAVLLAIGAVFAYFENRLYIALLALIIPGLMVLLGLETILGLVFGLYRPRRPGEVSRPAFDSRVLGLLTRPESIGKIINETINYQFGFEISKSWFYRLLSKAITPLIVTGAVVLIGLTSLVFVAPQQQAVITRFGTLRTITQEPGLHFKLPWPIERATKYDVHRVHEIAVGSEGGGFKPGVPILWTNQHTESTEQFMVTAPTRYVPPADAGDVSDESDGGSQSVAGELIGARAIVKYRVSDLRDYATSAENPVQLLQQLATRRLNLYFASHDVDTLLTRNRAEAGAVIAQALQADIDAFKPPLGLEVVFVGFDAIHPPQNNEVASKFHEQIDARQEKASAIQDAEKVAITTLTEIAGSRSMALKIDEAIAQIDRTVEELNRASESDAPRLREQLAQQEAAVEKLLDEAGGRSAQLIYEARAYRWQRALGEQARAMKMAALHNAYRQAPDYFRKRMYLETLAEGLKGPRKIVIVGSEEGTRDIRLNLESQGTSVGGFFEQQ